MLGRRMLEGWSSSASSSPPNDNAIEKNFVCLYVILTSLYIQWTFLTRYKSGTNVFWRTARRLKRLQSDILMLMLELLPRFVNNKHETSSKIMTLMPLSKLIDVDVDCRLSIQQIVHDYQLILKVKWTERSLELVEGEEVLIIKITNHIV